MQSPLPPSNRPRHHRKIGSIITTVLLTGVSVFIWLNHQYIVDSISFWRYQPTSAVEQVTSRAKLSDSGKFNFYAAQPSIDDSNTFNAKCSRKESNTAILGCYTDDRIYIYDVTDTRLDGIKEVTAAHEMLHAVYQRLSPSDKQSVDQLVEAEYQKLLSNPTFAERMAFYARTEPGERDNELHSIIGTEVGSISPELEAHYAKYFNDRGQIVSMYNTYNSVFVSLSDQSKQLAAELEKISGQIKSASDQYNADVKSLNADIASFNQRANAGYFTSQSQFNTQRQTLVVRANTISAERVAINVMVDRYNTFRDQYNDTVTQSNNLYKSLDSSLSPAPKV